MTPITSYLKSSRAACTAASVVLSIQAVNQIASRYFKGGSSSLQAGLHFSVISLILTYASVYPVATLYFLTAVNLAALYTFSLRRQTLQTTPDFLVDMSLEVNDEDILMANESRIQDLQLALKNSQKPNVVLVGLPGVGKTALVKHVAALLKKGQIDSISRLHSKRIFHLDHNFFKSETKYVGVLNEKIKHMIDFCTKNPDVYIFIDEFHLILDAGKSSNTKSSAADYLKEAITEGKIRIIGASTPREYEKYLSKNPAFERRFQRIDIKNPTDEECLQMLQHYSESSSFKEDYPNVKFTQEALEQIIKATSAIRPDFGQPDKARTALADIAGRCEGEIDGQRIKQLLDDYLKRNPQTNRRRILSDFQ